MTTEIIKSNLTENSHTDNVISKESIDSEHLINPLVNESLNHLVKRLDRTKVPKPPLARGQHLLKKKNKIFSSVPNVFFCSTDQFTRVSKSDKKSPWTNKLTFDIEKLKNAIRSNFDEFVIEKRRSSSIPILNRETNEFVVDTKTKSNIDLDTIKRNWTESGLEEAPILDKSISDQYIIESDDKIEEKDCVEHISPIEENIITEETKKIESSDQNVSKEKNVVKETRVKGKRGRKKKIEPLIKQVHENIEDKIIDAPTITEIENRNDIPSAEEIESTPCVKEFEDIPPVQEIEEKSSVKEIVGKCSDNENENLTVENIVDVKEANLSETKVKKKRGRKPKVKETKTKIIDLKVELDNSLEEISSIEHNSNEIKESQEEISVSVEKVTEHTKSVDNIVESKEKESEIIEVALDKSNDKPQEIVADKVEDIVSVEEKFDQYNESINTNNNNNNELEILSNSLSNSVDTSMLPPRKRYKRFMYLENTKQSLSPKTASLNTIDSDIKPQMADESTPTKLEVAVEKISVKDIEIIELPIKFAEKKQSPPSSNQKTSSSGKGNARRKTKSTKKSTTAKLSVLDDTFASVLDPPKSSVDTEDTRSRTSSSETNSAGKRSTSTREAAARGFANMVAMSLNTNNNNATTTTTSTPVASVVADVVSECGSSSKKTPAGSDKGSVHRAPVAPKQNNKKRGAPPSTTVAPAAKATGKTKPGRTPVNKKIKLEKSPALSIDNLIESHALPLKYRRIRTNNYIDCKPQYLLEEEVEKCACKPSKLRNIYEPTVDKKSKKHKSKDKSASQLKQQHKKSSVDKREIVWDCGENCLNRLIYTECLPKQCLCGDDCKNQRIRKGDGVSDLKLIDVPGKGKAVVSKQLIKEGTFIIEYVGDVINEDTFHDRMSNDYSGDAHHYCLHVDGDLLIDAYRCGSLARFINHSCSPNCEMQKWLVNGAYRMCIFAAEDIVPGSELSYDYNFCCYNTNLAQPCLCGSSNCRGVIGSKPRKSSAEMSTAQLLRYRFGKLLNPREKLFIRRHSVFLLRNRESGRCSRLGIRLNSSHNRYGRASRLPSTITEIKRRKARKNQFLTQLSALNSIRSMRTRQLSSAQDNQLVTRIAQLGQILRDLYNSLLEQKDPANVRQQLVLPFITSLNPKKYAEFYRSIGLYPPSLTSQMSRIICFCLNDVEKKLLDGQYSTMLDFDRDILEILHRIEIYAGKQSQVGRCVERTKPIYREIKQNSIALYEALFEQPLDDKDIKLLLSNNLHQVSQALDTSNDADVLATNSSTAVSRTTRWELPEEESLQSRSRNRMDRGAEVIRCVCGYHIEAGHVMVQCDKCYAWQHARCMNIAFSSASAAVVNSIGPADVTRAEPYFCHVCKLGCNYSQTLTTEMPRDFHITDESVAPQTNIKLYWTLYSDKCKALLKIDDFVYLDFSNRTIMRIYSLWKDENNIKWMEGGLFLRPYDSRLQHLFESTNESSVVTSTKKSTKKSAASNEQQSMLWHRQELVYTEFTEILPLDRALAQCFVLNNHTFKQGRPIPNNISNIALTTGASGDSTGNFLVTNTQYSLDYITSRIFVCDWMVDQQQSNRKSHWSELDPAYLKINTKPYCFEKWTTLANIVATIVDSYPEYEDRINDIISYTKKKFERQYSSSELKQMDQGLITTEELEKNKSILNASEESNTSLQQSQYSASARKRSFDRLIDKLREFARDRYEQIALSCSSGSSSIATSCGADSSSNASSRGASPLIEDAGTCNNQTLVNTKRSRKNSNPRKFANRYISSITCKPELELHQAEDEEPVKREHKNKHSECAALTTTVGSTTTSDASVPVNNLTSGITSGISSSNNSPDVSSAQEQINFGQLEELLCQQISANTVASSQVLQPSVTSRSSRLSEVAAVSTTTTSTVPVKTITTRKRQRTSQTTPTKPINPPPPQPTSTRRGSNTRSNMVKKSKLDPAPPASSTISSFLPVDTPHKESIPVADKDISESTVVDNKEETICSVAPVIDDDCFVKLERMRLELNSESSGNQLQEITTNQSTDNSIIASRGSAGLTNPELGSAATTAPVPVTSTPCASTAGGLSSRSKRKKGVPKRITTGDFSYGPSTPKQSSASGIINPSSSAADEDDVDNAIACIASSIAATAVVPPITTPTQSSLVGTFVKHNNSSQPITSTTKTSNNDFSSIENISKD